MRYDLPLTEAVPITLEPFAKPRQGKKPHILFVNSVQFGREIAQLMQLYDMRVSNVTLDKAWDLNKWGLGDFYHKRGDEGDQSIMLDNLQEALDAEEAYDCMVLPAINGWRGLSEGIQQGILRRVRAGMGLLLVNPMEGEGPETSVALEEISPLTEGAAVTPYTEPWYERMISGATWKAQEHAITRGIAWEQLAYERLAVLPYQAQGETVVATEAGEPVVAIRQVGKGRVAAFGFYGRDILPQHKDFRGLDGCFNPVIDTWLGAGFPYDFGFMEQFYRLTARALDWCCGLEPVEQIHSAAYENGCIAVDHTGGALWAGVVDAQGTVVCESAPRENPFPLPEHMARKGGSYRVQLSLRRGTELLDHFTLGLALPSITRLTLTLDQSQAREGDALTARLTLDGPAQGLALALLDDYGRVLLLEERDAAPVQEITLPLQDILACHVHGEAVALEGGQAVAWVSSAPCVITPKDRKLHDFEVFMNPQNRGQGDLLPYVNQLFPQLGMTGSFVGDNRLTAMSGAHGLGVYWYNRRPYVEKRERYLETGDKAHLVRTPCINDEAYWAENRAVIHEKVEAQKQYGPIGYFAQDEGSITCYSDELDLCFCEKCLTGMRAWLREQYGTLDALNQSWGEAYTSFEQAMPMTRREARQAGRYASWADHRRYMELCYTGAYRRMRTYIQEKDPAGEVRMSGCQASTAYTGNDYDLLHQVVGYFEAYPVGGQYEFHRSFKRPETILGGWFGYGARGDGVRHNIWNALFHGLTLISIFWEYALLNPDFTFSQSALDMGVLYREIRREGLGKLLLYGATRDDMGIALHYSMASVHATNVLGKKEAFEENRTAWTHMLEDLGLQYRFVSSRQIEEGALDTGCRLLILPYSIALSDQEAAAIEAFVEAGGHVIGDLQTGLFTDHCARREQGVLDDLFGIRRLHDEWEFHYLAREYAVDPHFDLFDLTGLEDEDGLGVLRAEAGTRPGTGQRAFQDTFSGYGASVILHQPKGKGKTAYLNFAMQAYLQQRQEKDGGRRVRLLLGRLLAYMGICPPLILRNASGGDISGLECVAYELSDGQIYGIKKSMGPVRVQYDGLAKDVQQAAEQGEPMSIRFPQTGHLYDVRAKEYLGQCQEITTNLRDGDVKLYALLPYRGQELRITALEEGWLEARLLTQGPTPETTVFAVNVTGPDGRHSSLYSRNHVVHGACLRLRIPFAENDAGVWRVDVKDVPTGLAANIRLEQNANKLAELFVHEGYVAP